ncbi:beta-lactamase-like protein [Dactylonectria macrodidyma]|uniref:Beta-lactamase-like protein n=1 Tax=Dactylonectria macrodidyma TaxID=307937 RepID=A0A9P9FIX7_9HYPO|nr:beta-lactamase-like protein [Dactylonectria macrodidyma]
MHSQGFAPVHVLSAGCLTLPERFFKTVPSLSFLIQHKYSETQKTTRIVFDLGIRRKLGDYLKAIYQHAMTRQPLSGEHDTLASLASGGLTHDHIDMVVFSHLHWDHVGTPSDYPYSTYIVGPGAVDLIEKEDGICIEPQTQRLLGHFAKPWQRKGHFESVADVFNDGGVYIVSALGHLEGHINLLCRLEDGSKVYLAGDVCHDERILSGEKNIATWIDREYNAIRDTVEDPDDLRSVEVIFAHDAGWAKQAAKRGSFFPGSL